MKTINLIGGGRVGQTLGHLLVRDGHYQVQDVLTRNAASAAQAVAFMGGGRALSDLHQLRPADGWMLCVPDAQIAPMASALAQLDLAQAPALAFHCSGALSAAELGPLKNRGWQVASAHCLMSFADPATALRQFAGTPCALEGDVSALTELRPLLTRLGGQCFDLAAADKLLYHAGAVFATNFLPVLQDVAERLWQQSGMPPELARQMRASLLANAVHNILALGPKNALTGPAARGDLSLVAAQGAAVAQWDVHAGLAYQALSQLAADMAAQRAAKSSAG